MKDSVFALLIVSVLALILGGIIADHKSAYYHPGETLDPSCVPSDPRCGVRP